MLAAHASLALVDHKAAASVAPSLEPKVDTYEVLFNRACRAIGEHNFVDAERFLKKAQKTCKSTLSDEEDKELLEQELAVITAQLAFVHQATGKSSVAAEELKTVLKCKGIDPAAYAVASNNLIAIRGDHHELFESAKNYKLATSANVLPKLNSMQRKAIDVNGALLSIYMGKNGPARDQLEVLDQKYPDNDRVWLARAALAYRQKKSLPKLRQELEARASACADSLEIQLALLQVYLDESSWDKAIMLIESWLSRSAFEHYRPGLISVLAWLHDKVGNHAAALAALESATKSNSMKGDSTTLLSQLAEFKLRLRRFKDAARDYLQLVKADPLDTRALAGLIIAYSHYDATSAEKHSEHLPSSDQANDSLMTLDTDALETAIMTRKTLKTLALDEAGQDENAMQVDKTKKKRKRKTILPKNYDPNTKPDPERWIPKRFRSTYIRKGKNKRDLLKGPQGVNMEGGGIGRKMDC
eukprot:jgi/Hompol1/4785/HPOL_003880-RA